MDKLPSGADSQLTQEERELIDRYRATIVTMSKELTLAQATLRVKQQALDDIIVVIMQGRGVSEKEFCIDLPKGIVRAITKEDQKRMNKGS